ncbi:MAG: lipopolysaccharide heptosyltransferase II [Candidatus Omnitrophica bacterium]|nr:lipopolysaccharide heptosyltransferase II [Candidatus Omnitrophota bacterium]
MRTLQILPSLEVGGVERGVIDLARAMKMQGHKTVVISSGGALVKELQKMGVSHYTLAVHKKSLLSLALVPKLVKILRRERIDVVHARSRVPAWLAWLACRQTGIPFVTTCHGYYSTHLLSRIMGWGKRVIVISNVVGRHMIDHFAVSPERIRLIHRGLDIEQFPHRFERYESRPETLRIINVGRLSPIKGQVEFLHAIHQLRQKLQRIEVLIVGSEGKGKNKYTHKLQETVRQLGLESCVKMLGTRRDIAELLTDSDLLVLGTLVPEAFGRVVIEAGAVGTAVLATRVGGVLDIIEDGKNGVLVPPGDVPAMAEAMFDLLVDRAKAASLAGALYQKVKSQFTLDQMIHKTIAVYEEVHREKKILLIKLGAMGDLILITPSLRMIRNRYPKAHISLLVDKALAPLISTSPYLNEVIMIDRKKLSKVGYLLKWAKKLRRESFDLSVDFQNTKWTHLLSALSGIPARYGFARGKFGFLVNRPDKNFETVDAPVKHQFRILTKLGISKLDDELELPLDAEAEDRIEQLLTRKNEMSLSPRVGFVMESSEHWPTKRWPFEHFRQLAGELVRKCDCDIVLIGSGQEPEKAEELRALHPHKILNLSGKTNLKDLVSLIKRLDVIVTGDTAPLHVAAAVGTRIVSFFGPTDPRRHMPPAEDSIVLTRHLACQPCYSGVCRMEEQLACMKKISVQEVFNAVLKQLAGKKVKIERAQSVTGDTV